MLVAGSNRRVFGLDSHAGIAVTGLSADGRQLVNRAREEAQSYSNSYGSKVIPTVLANRIALYMHYFTLHASLRPFGSSALIAAYDEDLKTPELYMVEPSGVCFRYFGCAAGKGAQAAKTELEKVMTKYSDATGAATITVREAVTEVAKILYLIRDVSKDRPFELELGWLCEESKMEFALVPKDLVEAADAAAKAAVVGSGESRSASASASADSGSGSGSASASASASASTPMDM
jgi:20S proteasome subunit alpha 7